jgi:hypothetical protein
MNEVLSCCYSVNCFYFFCVLPDNFVLTSFITITVLLHKVVKNAIGNIITRTIIELTIKTLKKTDEAYQTKSSIVH